MSATPSADQDAAASAELAKIEARLLELAEMFAAEEIDRGEWMRARNGLEERAKAARASLQRRERSGVLAPYSEAGALRRAWPTLDEQRRRGVISAVAEYIASLLRIDAALASTPNVWTSLGVPKAR